VYYTAKGDEVVYMTAAIGVVLNTANNKQVVLGGGEKTTFVGHSDDVTALAISSDRTLLVTGSVGKNP
jgi:hypothetical protein